MDPSPDPPSMDVNIYGRQLLPAEIEALQHRAMVGGLWDEVGPLQLDFMKAQGLQPHHRLVDVGCGALRGGVQFVRYLDEGCYYGLDINASLIEAGRRELAQAGLAGRQPRLLVNDRFELGRFGTTFDAAIAVSVLTHLPMNHIVRCLVEVGKVLAPGARFYASYFEAPAPASLAPLRHTPGDITTFYDADPFHYAFAEIQAITRFAGLTVRRIGHWDHPCDQQMLVFANEG